MKILFVHNTYQYYGGEDAVLQAEVLLLQKKGHLVKVLKFTNDALQTTGSKLKAGSASIYNFHSAKKLEKEIKEFTPDIVHIHNIFFTASPSVIIKANQLNVPVVMTIHNYRLICANALLLRNNKVCELCVNKILPLDGIRYKCYRSSYIESAVVTGITSFHKLAATWRKKVTQYIVLGEFAKTKLLHSSLQLPEHKLWVKPNFIFDPGLPIAERENHFLFVGRLSIEKGIEILLEFFAANPQFKLLIAGDGPEKETVMKLIETTPNIKYAGHQPKEKVLKLMATCKALIFPSIWYEGLPTTIIEAFATGTPVIASNLGAMSEMISNNYNGYLFEPGNVLSLEDKLKEMMKPGYELYKQARLTYEEKYHPDIHYKQILKIYKKAMEEEND